MPPKGPKGKSVSKAQKRKQQEPRPDNKTDDESQPEPEEEDESVYLLERRSEEPSESCKKTQEMDERICDFFSQNSFYYDLTHEAYKGKKRRDNTLAEFTLELGPGWTGEKVWNRFKSLRTDYGKIKALIKKGKSGSGMKKFTQKQQWKLRAFQFLDPYSRKGVCS